MPIKATYCNSFFQACKDDYFCVDSVGGGTTWFDSAVVNGAGNCTLTSGNCQTFGDIYSAPSLHVLLPVGTILDRRVACHVRNVHIACAGVVSLDMCACSKRDGPMQHPVWERLCIRCVKRGSRHEL